MEVGIKGEQKFVVTNDKLACNVGSGIRHTHDDCGD